MPFRNLPKPCRPLARAVSATCPSRVDHLPKPCRPLARAVSATCPSRVGHLPQPCRPFARARITVTCHASHLHGRGVFFSLLLFKFNFNISGLQNITKHCQQGSLSRPHVFIGYWGNVVSVVLSVLCCLPGGGGGCPGGLPLADTTPPPHPPVNVDLGCRAYTVFSPKSTFHLLRPSRLLQDPASNCGTIYLPPFSPSMN